MDKTHKIIDFFFNNSDSLKKLDYDSLKDIIVYCWIIIVESNIQDFNLNYKAFIIMTRILCLNTLPIADRCSIYYQLIYYNFINTTYDSADQDLRNAYDSICSYIESFIPAHFFEPSSNYPLSNNIVITTSQFLSEGHAPTRRVLDYAHTIEQQTDFKVYIINTAVMHTAPLSYLSKGYINFNYIDSYCQVNNVEYKGKPIPFYQVKGFMPDYNNIILLLDIIKNLNPRLVFNVGASDYISDICKLFSLTACIPCSTAIPVSTSERLILGRNIRPSDKKVIDSLPDYQSVIESSYNYKMPEESSMTHYSRQLLNLPNQSWLIGCSGNRMEAELDSDFLQMMDKVLTNLKNAYYIVVGPVFDSEKIVSKLVNKEKFIFLGQKKDASQVIRLFNLYVAPTRKGGGRSSFEALYYGIPVIVTAYGDSWDTCGSIFEVNDYSEMSNAIERYYYDAQFYRDMKVKALARGQELEDMSSTFTKLFEKLGLT